MSHSPVECTTLLRWSPRKGTASSNLAVSAKSVASKPPAIESFPGVLHCPSCTPTVASDSAGLAELSRYRVAGVGREVIQIATKAVPRPTIRAAALTDPEMMPSV
jgi:hypothetical protein